VLFCLFYYGTLCRFKETANLLPAVSLSGVLPIATYKEPLRNNLAILICFFTAPYAGYTISTLEIRLLFFETNFVKVLIPFIGVRMA
jgi:hypothetical protein